VRENLFENGEDMIFFLKTVNQLIVDFEIGNSDLCWF